MNLTLSYLLKFSDAICVPDPLMLISNSLLTDRRLIQNAECLLVMTTGTQRLFLKVMDN